MQFATKAAPLTTEEAIAHRSERDRLVRAHSPGPRNRGRRPRVHRRRRYSPR